MKRVGDNTTFFDKILNTAYRRYSSYLKKGYLNNTTHLTSHIHIC